DERRADAQPDPGVREARARPHSVNRYFRSTQSATTPSRHVMFLPSSYLRCRSAAPAAATEKARRSRGETASSRSGCGCSSDVQKEGVHEARLELDLAEKTQRVQ